MMKRISQKGFTSGSSVRSENLELRKTLSIYKMRKVYSFCEEIWKFASIERERTRSKTAGFTLFVSLVLAGTLLLIATGIVNLAAKQSQISHSGRESQLAFYAADSGMECALFWDVKNPEGEQSAFATTTTSTITCNQDAANPDNDWVVGGGEVSIIEYITFLPDPYCAKVIVTKHASGTTTIESLGYNTCDPTNARRVERAVRATY